MPMLGSHIYREGRVVIFEIFIISVHIAMAFQVTSTNIPYPICQFLVPLFSLYPIVHLEAPSVTARAYDLGLCFIES